jgi:hypothetical protein
MEGQNQLLQSAPRVDATALNQYQGQVVRIVGKVEQQGQPISTLSCGDATSGTVQVKVTMSPGNQYGTTFVEVTGRVAPDGGLEEIHSYDLGDNFDVANYQQLLGFSSGQYREVFVA